MALPVYVSRRVLLPLSVLLALVVLPGAMLAAQGTGTITGTVTRDGSGEPLAGVSIVARESGRSAVTGSDGRYTLPRVPAGAQTIVFRWLGFRPMEQQVTVTSGGSVTADAVMVAAPVLLGDIVVSSASRAPERVVEAPAAVSTVPTQILDNTSITGQVPAALATVPGLDVAQSGVNDFSVNARGFNSTLNRRVLVLEDGRDLAIAFLGAQEWNGMTVPLEDLRGIEVVRGPGSALYGANAFSGVVNMTSQAAREVVGTKVTLAGGELETFRGDLRHAGVASSGRFGYRLNVGYNRSDTWSRSRTNPGDLAEEYEPATDEPVPPAITPEAIPISGQTLDPVTREALGDRDPLQNMYGTARFDVYRDNGGMITAEAGAARVENEILVTGIGRVQVLKAVKPYARVAWAEERFNVMGYWNSRSTLEPQRSLASGLDILEDSDIFHLEAQANQTFGPARVVVGSSVRNTNTNTHGSLMDPANDDRSDNTYSVFGQVEYEVIPQVKIVGAARFDDGDLYDAQFSPKAAVVVSPNENHSFRFTYNRAFQTPNYSEFFLRAPAGAPANFTLLEAGLRASPLGPALAGVPVGELYTNSAAVPVLALGNSALEVEHVNGWEAGYKANLGDRAFVTIDVYLNDLENFVTDLLPGVNPAYGAWTAPEAVPEQFRPAVEQATRDQLAAAGQPVAAAGLSRVNGNTAIVVSYANAGEVRERGIEIGVGYNVTNEFRVDASFTGFDFEVKSQATGDQLVPNTPSKKASFMVSYMGAQGFDANVGLRLIDGYPWAAGVFQGYVPAAELLSLGAGYRINNYLRVHATATNLLDQERFQIYGGSVLGRRLLGGVTANF
ncbi:MAG TPA: TonB-dependent receptor [Gemmatimonadales bacterium]|nr:TonB-dependent receptor [Gemmatimonadales bacterium]